MRSIPADVPTWPDCCPEWLDGWARVEDDDPWPALAAPPLGLVVHSGAKRPNVGEYAVDEPDNRNIAYHFPFFETLDQFAQSVSLRRRAGHAGSQGNAWWGIAWPGPVSQDPRPEYQKEQFLELVHALVAVSQLNYHRLPSGEVVHRPLRFWCRHSDISNHRDPGPGFKNEWMKGTGLIWQPSTVR
jgi:hypothetical protein